MPCGHPRFLFSAPVIDFRKALDGRFFRSFHIFLLMREQCLVYYANPCQFAYSSWQQLYPSHRLKQDNRFHINPIENSTLQLLFIWCNIYYLVKELLTEYIPDCLPPGNHSGKVMKTNKWRHFSTAFTFCRTLCSLDYRPYSQTTFRFRAFRRRGR